MTPETSRSRVALITGGGRGIGAETAKLLAADGWDLCIGYRSDADAAALVVAECEAAGRRAVAARGDVADPAGVAALFAAADQLGPLGALVNNAGIVAAKRRLDELTPERIERVLAVNVLGAFLCAKEAVLRMSTRHGGRGGVIVSLSSMAASLGAPDEYIDYAASKGAVDSMTVGLAREVAAEGIRVNAVRPGIIRTEIHASGGRPDRVEQLRHTIPMGRGGEPEEVAAAIAWLCSPAASYVTGAVLNVSGGR